MSNDTNHTGGTTALYGAAARAYLTAGWPSVLPLPHAAKTPPPGGYTGRDGAWPTTDQIDQWADTQPDGNLALRLPPDVIGIDVDAYNGKPGADTLATLETELGPLPDTLASTSRADGISGIRLYRTPPRPVWRDPGPGMEIIHAGWRYVIASPSIHPDTGQPYRWIDLGTGEIVLGAPPLATLPQLPDAWVDHLASDEAPTVKADVDTHEVDRWIGQLAAGNPCKVTRDALDRFHADLRAGGARHDAMLDATGRLARALERGHRGGPAALSEAHSAFLTAVTVDGSRTLPQAEAEWQRALHGAYALIAATPTSNVDRGCRCSDTTPTASTIDLTPLAAAHHDDRPPPADTQTGSGRERSSWWPVDGTPFLDGTYERPMPTQLHCDDGLALIYPGTTNVIMGESESGKSWLALAAAVQAVTRGDTVLFIDFEADPAVIYHRLTLLGADRQQLLERFRYALPDQALTEHTQPDLAETIDLNRPNLVVLDGITGAMGLHGLNPLENADAEAFDRLLPRRLADTGAAVLQIDHLPQNAQEDRRFALGAQHKLAAVSGAAYKFTPVRQFSPGRHGWGTLTISKDRHGSVRERHLTKAGEFHLDSAGETIVYRLQAPRTAPADEGKTFRPTTLMERVSELLERVEEPLTGRAIRAKVTGKDKGISLALQVLVDEGFVVQTAGENRSILHRLKRPYRAAEDPLADGVTTLSEPSGGSPPGGSRGSRGSPVVPGGSPAVPASPDAGGSRGSPGIHSRGTGNHHPDGPTEPPNCPTCHHPLNHPQHDHTNCRLEIPV